jgi:hypothetical protein
LIRTHQRAVGLLLVPRENTPDGQDQEIIVQQMEQFFFGEGAALPPNLMRLSPERPPWREHLFA